MIVIFLVFFSGKPLNKGFPSYTAKEVTEKLTRFYKLNSVDSLKQFLSEWHNTIQPSSAETISQNDTLANIYHLFIDLYKPFKFGDQKAMNPSKNKNEYIVIQTSISYEVVSDKRFKDLKRLENNSVNSGKPPKLNMKYLYDFRPKLNIDSFKCLYLTPAYERGIRDFIGTTQGDSTKAESYKRQAFISSFFPIIETHEGGNWYIESFPIIYKIRLDSSFKHALVVFCINMSTTVNTYPLVKIAGHWKVDQYNTLLMTAQ